MELSVPGIYLATTNRFGSVKGFEKFMDRSHLQHFKLVQDNHNFDRNNELLSTVVDRGIQHLDFAMYIVHRYVFMHQNIYKSKTLVSLKLFAVELKNPEFVVSLPCLKIMELSSVCNGKDGPLIVEKIISGSPVLEDLRLIRPFTVLDENVVLFLRVKSQSLKKCCFGFGITIRDTDFTVEIDAPRLEYLSLSNTQSDRIVVKNLSSLLLIDINTNVNSPLQAEDLTRISSVKHMIICRSTLEVLYCYSKLRPIPKLHNLYHLQTQFPRSSLPAFLETCRNLKALTLLDYFIKVKPEEINFTSLPRCLISTLEYVEIKKWVINEDGIKLVNYFLENSPVLKKLTLSFKHPTKQDVESYKKFLTSTKLSPHVNSSLVEMQ